MEYYTGLPSGYLVQMRFVVSLLRHVAFWSMSSIRHQGLCRNGMLGVQYYLLYCNIYFNFVLLPL